MLRSFMAIGAAAVMTLASVNVSAAAPLGAAPLSDLARSAAPIEKTRLFCYNKYTGRFLHWGGCGGGYARHYNRPRVYCKNRYTGRFIHWGAC